MWPTMTLTSNKADYEIPRWLEKREGNGAFLVNKNIKPANDIYIMNNKASILS